MRKLSLPSLGYWGDIGWAEARTTPGRMTVKLKQNDFYCARPLGFGRKGVRTRPAVWDEIIAANRGATCSFTL